ncbi:SDR family NAD(P)-dependent oxidoreductase [Parasedimentitalea huanghaiensis]|uniref:SDR family oxidoreductase n=1 Tax=Parasedimentitalea huanghaiensis TaxID=2682100 RepID=A0A6L6WG21_9RHOB|nr:SDR family NAD(P)-dependent oxidoreductase [Zongyanglinia huanghaiensis]MVO16654.1 SDR family oxidoreductase [Zongyanglinia huanghaiensis]
MLGKVAVVTGAGGGMGRAISLKLVQDGLTVVGLDVSAERLEETSMAIGNGFHSLAVDLTDATAVAEAFANIKSQHGGLDALVNNAGTCLMSDFPNIPASELNSQLAINFNSAFYCCQQAVPIMMDRPGVRKIINISSNGAYNFDVFDPPHYRASKAAMDTLTKDLARRYAAEKIAVNSIAPAMTTTPLFDVLTDEVLQQAISAMPHGRAMDPSEIASWVAFLISPAGDISSGNIIILNQGRDVR